VPRRRPCHRPRRTTSSGSRDPDRAERIAESITNDDRKASALATIAGAIAPTDPNG
jgi:hypothetical protein